jgi:opacity protein-like surface antigen
VNDVIKVIKKILVLGFLLIPAAVFAQVAPSVTGNPLGIWGGAEYSNFAPDYGSGRMSGIGGLVDIDVWNKFGLLGEARFLRWGGPAVSGETQSDYLGGVKYRFFRFHRLDFNAKFLIGGVWINYPGDRGSGSYFTLAPGAHVDYHFAPRFLVRAGYEYQLLPSAPGFPGFPSNGLTPNRFTIGVEYRIFNTGR